MNTVTTYTRMKKSELVKFALLLQESYRDDYKIVPYTKTELEAKVIDDIALDLVLQETDLYENYYEDKEKIMATRVDLYESGVWKQ